MADTAISGSYCHADVRVELSEETTITARYVPCSQSQSLLLVTTKIAALFIRVTRT